MLLEKENWWALSAEDKYLNNMRTIQQRSKVRTRTVKKGALNFEQMVQEGNTIINEVSLILSINRNAAARITKAVLHAIRDKLPPDDAIEFAQGLPLALKGVFIDQYDLSDAPVNLRNSRDFLNYIFYKDEPNANSDFPRDDSVEKAFRAVFSILERYMDKGQTGQVKKLLGKSILEILEANGSEANADYPLKFSDR
jgi:uncharacterized protein (DUF2267 family)